MRYLLFWQSMALVFLLGAANAEDHDHDEHEHGHEKESGEESAGISLSAEAAKNFGIKTKVLTGPGPWALPLSARLLSGEEVNLFRLRDGHYARVDFALLKKSGAEISVSSPDLRAGDLVVTEGVGFLRIAEIMATGGAPHGHSH